MLSHTGSPILSLKTYLLLSCLPPKAESTNCREWNCHGHLFTLTPLFSYLALHRGRSRRWFHWWCSQILFPSLHKALLCSQTRKEGCLVGVQSPLWHQYRTKNEKSTLLISLKMLILVVMGFFCRESVDCFFFLVNQINSEYRSSHPNPTNSRPSLGIKCIWYRTHRNRRRDEYDSTESYQTQPIFWTLVWWRRWCRWWLWWRRGGGGGTCWNQVTIGYCPCLARSHS